MNVFPKELSRNLHWAFDTRQASDYRSFLAISTEQALVALDRAESFVVAVEQHLQANGWC